MKCSFYQCDNIEFRETNLVNTFGALSSRTLSKTIQNKKYKKLQSEVDNYYSAFLNKSLPDFLFELKLAGDPFYKKFLNRYGDNKFCKFKLSENDIKYQKGLYLYLIDNRIMYVGLTTDSFYKRINAGYGNISPKNCYLDGQATNCHLNSIINDSDYNKVNIWICTLEDDQEIRRAEDYFIKVLKPSWNIALKPIIKKDVLYLTHCSESKNSNFENNKDLTTPDILYTSDRIKLFFEFVKQDDLSWAIFSDNYGFVFPSTLIQWYDYSPDTIIEADIEGFLKASITELCEYEKIIFIISNKPIHRTYRLLIKTMKSHGLKVVIEKI